MKFLMKRRLRSLISYFSILDVPALILNQNMQIIFSNNKLRDVNNNEFIDKIVAYLFSSKQLFEGYELEGQYIQSKEIHTVVFRPKRGQVECIEMGKEFIANASHELRTPITIIKGFAEALEDIQDISKEMLDSITQKILNSCHRMQGLVKNLLLLSDLDQTTCLKKKECALMSVVENAIEQLLLVYPRARVECFYTQDPISMQVNQELFELAIFNVLQNAVKYSRGDALIEVVVNRDEDGICVSIKDNGMGMDESQLDRIFKRFITVDKSHSRTLGGAGLGLSLVDLIVQKHDGKVAVESKLDFGTTISFKFNN